MISILLVEDDPIVRRGLVRQLERLGVNVIQAGTGEQAIFLLEQLGSGFDAVLSDHDLGDGMDGDDLVARVAERWPSLKRFGMSGYIQNWNEAIDAGRVVDAFEKADAAASLIDALEDPSIPAICLFCDGDLDLERGCCVECGAMIAAYEVKR